MASKRGSVCNPYQRRNNKISTCAVDDAQWSGHILSHEIGHALGMGHDMETNPLMWIEGEKGTNHLKRGCNMKGEMSYITDGKYPPPQWSVCSRTDFHDYVDWMTGPWSNNVWCLQEAPDACQ